MDVGLYVNLFEVNFEDHDVDFMHTDRSPYPKLRDLRQQLDERKIEAQVFATGGEVYGYGSEQNQLAEFGFRLKSVRVGQIPPLASRLVLNQTARDSYTTVTPCAASARRSSVGLMVLSPVNRASRGRQPSS